MIHDDRPTPDQSTPDQSTPDQGGLPSDLGNGMSSRAGWTDESESGRTDTPRVTDSPRRPSDREDRGIPDLLGQADDGDSTATTFGTTGLDDQRL